MYFCVALCIVCFVTFLVLFVCICVLNNCHRVATQLQLNISYHTIHLGSPGHSAAGAWSWPLPSPSGWSFITNAPRVYDFMARCLVEKIVPFYKTRGFSRRFNLLYRASWYNYVMLTKKCTFKINVFINFFFLLHVSNILCPSLLSQVKTYHFYAFIDNLKN
jgi:hypothetical protein